MVDLPQELLYILPELILNLVSRQVRVNLRGKDIIGEKMGRPEATTPIAEKIYLSGIPALSAPAFTSG